MKKVILTLLLAVFMVSSAMAANSLTISPLKVEVSNWKKVFSNTYILKGIDYAVIYALGEGESPEFIIEEGRKFEKLNPIHLIKALYCAGADGTDIREGAYKNGVSDLILDSGFKLSIAECGEAMADSQAYTTGSSFSGAPTPTSGGNRTYASPATFE